VRPKILLTDTDRRPYVARLAIGLTEAGCDVWSIATSNHPLLKTSALKRSFPYSPFHPLESLLEAIEETAPDLVVPCCDRGVQHLHDLHTRLSERSNSCDVVDLIERSLGPSQSFPIVTSRYDLLLLAQEEGLRVPKTRVIRSAEDLETRQAEQPLPCVLKSDGTWGGRGVRIAYSPEQARQFFSEISRPFGLGRVIKRLCVNRDPFWIKPWLSGSRPTVIAQSLVNGRPANCAVVCWQGKVLSGIGVEVVSTNGPTGPATVVRIVEDSEMMICAERIARRLGLSGFFGLDFMIEEGTRAVYLIEMNPRCTPVCHLRLGRGRDMMGTLWAQLSGNHIPETVPVTDNRLIAYFPQAWNAKSEFLQSSFQDIPRNEPGLIEECLQSWPERTLLYRLASDTLRLTSLAATFLSRKRSGYSES
jgi:carbamoylphosphate synthase large subunit